MRIAKNTKEMIIREEESYGRRRKVNNKNIRM